jgi:hypothetical protein
VRDRCRQDAQASTGECGRGDQDAVGREAVRAAGRGGERETFVPPGLHGPFRQGLEVGDEGVDLDTFVIKKVSPATDLSSTGGREVAR